MTTPVPPPLNPGQFRLHDSAEPKLRPGDDYQLEVGQEVDDADGKLASIAALPVKFKIVDPGATTLPASEVLAVYPPAGAQDAVDDMLPHIVLRSRTLPWVNASGPDSPWIALLLFVHGVDKFEFKPGMDGRERAWLTNELLRKLLPQPDELGCLCHIRELPTDDPVAAKDDDRFVAIVLGNRLPYGDPQNQKKITHTACLVDLRGMPDTGDQQLPVLHRWSFEVSGGGDFQAYFARLRRADGAGHVVAFGSATDGEPITSDTGELDLVAPQPGAPTRTVGYAGPCVPLPLGLIDAPADDQAELLGLTGDNREVVTYAAAFELGRLLALANPRVLDAILTFRDAQFQADVEVVIHTPIPGVPRPGPGICDTWKEILHDPGDWIGSTTTALWQRASDPTGIMPLVGQIPGLGVDQLAKLGSTRFQRRLDELGAVAGPGAPIGPTNTVPDLANVDIFHPDARIFLSTRFAELTTVIADKDLDIARTEFER